LRADGEVFDADNELIEHCDVEFVMILNPGALLRLKSDGEPWREE